MFIRRGVPPQWRKYDVDFLRWLHATGKQPDIITESDLESIRTAEELIRLYDFVVFPGHTEYVTRHEYDLIEGYRNLGGNLAFLSANNFFWEVRLQGRVLRRTRLWRSIGRPESALLGVQYRANDDGRLQRPFVVRSAATAPWLWAGTGLVRRRHLRRGARRLRDRDRPGDAAHARRARSCSPTSPTSSAPA